MNITRILIACMLFSSLGMGTTAFAQNKIELLGASSLKFDKNLGVDAQRLIGNVRFKHKGALMYCDSAYLYNQSNSLDAFGNVKINQGDTLTLFSEKLFYNGNTQLVQVRDSVILNDNNMSLKTNTLDYNRKTSLAVFTQIGTITSTENENTLVSKQGTYNASSKMFHFRDSVRLHNPNYTVVTDTLDYANELEIAYFKGPTFIYSDENTIYCQDGYYNTQTDLSEFNQDAYLKNVRQKLSGDKLIYDRNKGVGEAFGNVLIQDSTDQYIINGQYGYYTEHNGRSLVTGEPEFIQYDAADSLYLHGDTLIAIQDSILGNKVLVYPEVRFYRSDMQGAADSLSYSENDSLIQMYHNPVLWADDMQITGDTIYLKSHGGVIENLFVFNHSFMVNKLDSIKYNQIKGKKLTGYFVENELQRVIIEGNGESIYYAAESENKEQPDALAIDTLAPPAPIKYIGVNKAICSNIAIYIKQNQIDRIAFLTRPDGAFYPVDKFPTDESIFDGFEWQSYRRPLKHSDIFLTPQNPSSGPISLQDN